MDTPVSCLHARDGLAINDGSIVYRWCSHLHKQVEPHECNNCPHHANMNLETPVHPRDDYSNMNYKPCPCALDKPHISSRAHPDRTCLCEQSQYFTNTVLPIQCKRCELHKASTDGESPTLPPLSRRIISYAGAVGNWIAKGRPDRSNEEVEAIYNTHCVPCSWLNPKTNVCNGCGCRVARNGVAVTNKIKMATEHCPQGKW